MSETRAMVIVGAGHVGGRAALALRSGGWSGPIVLIGQEPDAPCERPPLSKGVLTGEHTPASCLLATPDQYAEQGITLKLGQSVAAIQPAQRCVTLQGGEIVPYEALLLATGGQVRTLSLPGSDLPGIHTLRTLADARALQPRLKPGQRVAVVGGGFIGLEVAASARQLGCEVTLLEGAQRLLGRAVPAAIGERVADLHRQHGVDLMLGSGPESFSAVNGRIAVRLLDGQLLMADTVVVGIGITPSVQLARAAGLAIGTQSQGITVDARLQTSERDIYAAGDVAEAPSVLSGRQQRQETWQNAEAQAAVAAANMLGGTQTCETLPWFWSDQYDHTLQVSGEPALAVHEVQRPMGDGAALHFYLDAAGLLVGASGFGPIGVVSKELKLARTLVERRLRLQAADLANPSIKLKSLLSGAAVAAPGAALVA
jgi:3-phenylpropionate/trans-cinnamate dioxygenase ferredoxin reductase subunit